MAIELQDIIISLCSLVITGLGAWAVSALTKWLDYKLENKKSQHYAQEALDIVTSCVKATYQTYVEAIKGTEAWTKEAQQHALDLATNTAKAKFSADLTSYITDNYGDVNLYVIGLVESILYDLKNW